MLHASGDPDTSLTDENGNSESLAPKTQVKRNVAMMARLGHRRFFFPPRYNRNMAWFARTSDKDSSYSLPKRTMNNEAQEDLAFEPYREDDLDYAADEDPYIMDKRNIASLADSRSVPSFLSGFKRHVGSAIRYRGEDPSVYYSPQKRFFASLLKSDSPPPSIYPRMYRRMSYFDQPRSKKFFSSLLENDLDAPGEDVEKRHFASFLDRENPYEGKRSFASLLKSDSGIGMPGKRYYSSLLDNTALENLSEIPNSQLLESVYDRQNDLDKRTFSSLLNRKNPYNAEKHLTKRHIGSLRDTSKRFYGSILDNSPSEDSYDKRSFNSLLKSSNYHQPDKKHVGAALRYRQGKRDQNDREMPTEEELELDDLQKRFIGSLLDDTPAKRHLASLLDSRDARGGYFYGAEPYPILNQEEKRYIASLLDNRPLEQKRFIGSLMDSDTPPYAAMNNLDKKHLGSAINSRMRYMNEGKRFLGSTINSRMNFLNGNPEEDKRFVGSVVQSRHDNKGIEEGKRFYGSILDNTPASGGQKTGESKRFVGSALKSKGSSSDSDLRGKRETEGSTLGRQKRSIALDEKENEDRFTEGPEEELGGSDGLRMGPVKRFLRE